MLASGGSYAILNEEAFRNSALEFVTSFVITRDNKDFMTLFYRVANRRNRKEMSCPVKGG